MTWQAGLRAKPAGREPAGKPTGRISRHLRTKVVRSAVCGRGCQASLKSSASLPINCEINCEAVRTADGQNPQNATVQATLQSLDDNEKEVTAMVFCEIRKLAKDLSSQAFVGNQNGLLSDRKKGQKQAAENV